MFRGRILTLLAFGTAIGVMMPARHAAPDAGKVAVSAPASAKTRFESQKQATIRRDPDGHFYAAGEINGQPVRFLVDTGATTVVITASDAKRLGIDFSTDRFSALGQSVDGTVMGQEIELGSVAVGGVSMNAVRAIVIADGIGVSLLGQSFLNRLASVSITGSEMTLN